MSGAPMRFEDVVLTDPGKVRTNNEDAILGRPEAGLWVVADGMGGHARGEVASAAIVDALAKADAPDDFDTAANAAAEAIHAANGEIYAQAQVAGSSMGATVVSLLLRPGRFAVFWAGDSRCYLLRDKMLYQLSTDHSQVQDMVAAGRLTPEEAEGHPMGHVLSRAVGVEPSLRLDAVSDEAIVGDIFLLCSDGLTRTISDPELATILGGARPRAAAEQLIALSLERGAPDNVSVAVVACESVTLLALA